LEVAAGVVAEVAIVRVEVTGANPGVTDGGTNEQLAPDGFASAAFEENVVGHNDRRPTVLLEDGEDVLEEVELLVARAGPEIVAMHDE